jgi:aspartate/methionine/tyrosine aminotransferase
MFELLPQSPFARLAQLLAGVTPNLPPIQMALGEPQHKPPDFVGPLIAQHALQFGKYPPIQGPEALRISIRNWLARRYGLNGALDAERHILPLVGTREGLFTAPFALAHRKADRKPVILIPNPFYQCYSAAALAAGCEPVYVNATRETGFLPAFDRMPRDILARTVAVYVCSPSNPEGAVAQAQDWRNLFALAELYDFSIFADECYAEIYDDMPPPGALGVRHQDTGGFDRVVAFHSLSKRSSLPGLRSGFAAGDAAYMERFRSFRNVAGPTMPLPVALASAAVWDEETHVNENRALYRQKFDLAGQILGNRFGYRRPAGGFFLWLETGDGEAAARKLWQDAGVRVLPGAYLAQDTPEGNPGSNFVRVALVNDFATTQEALRRIAQTL